MHYKKDPCRNFQRGSCQYGERCKFLHVIQQPQKSSDFGFGMQASSQQQQKSSRFGFGVNSTGQSKAAADFGSKQNQYKPFENKWVRSSTPTGDAPSRKSDNQLPPNHKCTDGESCKRQIVVDFQKEWPLWKLTCYGHIRNEACDIVGDVSYEELRAIAYDEAKRGINLQSIVERERNLLNSKLAEFESLLHKPYVTPLNPSPGNQSSFSGTNSHSMLPSAQNSAPPSLSSFSQLGASLNAGFGARPSTSPSNAFGQPVQVSSSLQSSSGFGITNLPLTSAVAVGGALGSQLPSQTFGNSTLSGFNNSGIKNAESNLLSSSTVFTKIPSMDASSSIFSAGSNSSAGGQIVSNAQLLNKLQQESSVDVNIWLKEKWVPGEIPEVAPPDALVQQHLLRG